MKTSTCSLVTVTVILTFLAANGHTYVDTKDARFTPSYFYNNKKYVYFSTKVGFEDAQKLCTIGGGQLATIRNEDENRFILKLRLVQEQSKYWIRVNNWQQHWESESGRQPFIEIQNNSTHDRLPLNKCSYVNLNPEIGIDKECNNTLPYICSYFSLNSNHTQNMKCLLHDDGGPCYEIIDIPATLSEATEDCAFRGGTLALIDNQKTHNFLRSLIYRNSQKILVTIDEATLNNIINQNTTNTTLDDSEPIWIGLRRGHRWWEYEDGTSAQFLTPYTLLSMTNIEYDDNCLKIRLGMWVIDKCDESHPYFCQYPQNCSLASYCLNDICYSFIATPQSHTKSQINCKSAGGTLAKVKTKEIQNFLLSLDELRMADTYNGIWIGGYLRAPFYEYVDGTPLTFVNADPHQPSLPLAYGPKKVDLNEFKPPINELDIDACVHLTARNTWQRGTCSQLSPFICEYSEYEEQLGSDPEFPCPKSCIIPRQAKVKIQFLST